MVNSIVCGYAPEKQVRYVIRHNERKRWVDSAIKSALKKCAEKPIAKELRKKWNKKHPVIN
ncbi:MAG: hypothetical protein WC947_09465 [Elusimicrobiota bacterium]